MARESDLETATALALGRMLFAFSRLDMLLGLALVWMDEGKQLKALTKRLGPYNFDKRLKLLEREVSKKYDVASLGLRDYESWLVAAHSTKNIRNELVHGRWGVATPQGKAFNVIGLPTSPDQRETGYTVAELEQIVAKMESLQTELARLRKRWPI